MPKKLKRLKNGRMKFRKVEALRKWLNAYGRGKSGDLDREQFAKRLGVSRQYLVQIGLGIRRASMETAVKIEKATYGQVCVEELHPSEDWEYIAKRKAARGGAAHA